MRNIWVKSAYILILQFVLVSIALCPIKYKQMATWVIIQSPQLKGNS